MGDKPQSVLEWLEEFYRSHCDGDWEQGVGFTIATLDNPGWSVDLDLESTPLEDKDFKPITQDRTDEDWVHCRVEGRLFQGRGGAKNLTELLTIFRDWAENNDN